MIAIDMRIIARKNLDAYGAKHPVAKASLQRWIELTRDGNWKTTAEIQAGFATAKVLNDKRVRFEVAGGKHGLIAAFDFGRQIAFIKFVGTHAEYDAIEAATVSKF